MHNRLRRGLNAALPSALVGSFSPISVSGLLTWFDFSDFNTLFQSFSSRENPTHADEIIGTVADKSGNNYDLHSATFQAIRRDNIKNGLCIASVEAGNEVASVSIPNTIGTGDFYHIFAIRTPSNVSTIQGLLTLGAVSSFSFFSAPFAGKILDVLSGNTFNNIYNGEAYYILESYRISGIEYLAYNGVIDTYSGNFTTSLPNPITLSLFRSIAVSSSSKTTYWLESCFYQGYPSSQISNLRTYFNSKWAVY